MEIKYVVSVGSRGRILDYGSKIELYLAQIFLVKFVLHNLGISEQI